MNNKNQMLRLALQALLLAQALVPISAHALDLADVPMAVQNRASPNIMFTLDNSGSMAWAFMPDSIFSASNGGALHCYKNGIANGVYYHPATTYRPGKDATGASLPDAVFTGAYVDGYKLTASYRTSASATPVSTPVDLSALFQAYFDINGAGYYDTQQAAYHYKYIGTNPAIPQPGVCYANTSYQKVLVSATSGPGATDERVNFANWFTYHRTRMLTMKTGLSTAFAAIGKNYRVGLSTINKDDGGTNNNGDNFVPLSEFKSCAASETCHKNKWYAALFAVQPRGGTPLVEASRKVGEYFRTGAMPGVSPATADPITYSCQQNFQILSTDGYWNGTLPAIGNQDRTVPTLPQQVAKDPIAGKALTPGNSFPPPFYEGNTETSNTLADVAMRYWSTDLRAGMDNNVVANDLDPATWQHLVTSSIGLGANGSLSKDKATYDKLVSGEISWPKPVADTSTAIDDLWHAAVNGHGEYFSAKNPGELQAGLADALSNIVARAGAAAAVAVNNPNLSTSDNVSFASRYNAGEWSGNLFAYPINAATGAVDTNAPIWTSSAQAQLDGKVWSTRLIGSYSGTTGVAFGKSEISKSSKVIRSGLTDAQLSRLNSPVSPPGLNDHSAVIDFLRGNRSGELDNATVEAPYRKRQHVLGDIVNSRSVYVAAPPANYGDDGFAKFKADQKARKKMVYQGANDGMLHAFDAATGAELWAYVPGLLISEPYTTPTVTYSSTSSLVNLSMKSSFSHRYYVDGTPVQGDVDFGNTENATGGTNWRTLLVGGLNKGGRGYFALDITDPAAASDDDVAAKVKWEFPNDATAAELRKNIGYSYGKPLIVKTPAAGWVVLVTSGYDNGSRTGGDGQGRLHVLNPRTGAIIKTINTGAGSEAEPSGLGQVSAYVENGDLDLTIDYAYAGDLLGNLWRFDLSGATKDAWNVVKLAALVDQSGKPQPITTAPELGKSGANRLVLVGTGQYLGNSDVPGTDDSSATATQVQSFYALVDAKTTAPLISPLRAQLQEQVFTVAGTTASVSSNLVDLATKKGWYVDFPNSGERSVTNPALLLGVVAFTTVIPAVDPCKPGGSSWLYLLDYKNGQQTALPAGQFLGDALASEVVAVKTTTGSVNGIIVTSDGKIIAPPLVPSSTGGSGVRKMWREILIR